MKTLHTEGNYNIGILDENNYVVWDSRKDKESKGGIRHEYKYFTHMYDCIREVSRLSAGETASDLSKWMGELHTMHSRLLNACLGV